ncbi:MAG: hypothetical protein QOH79_975 [Acidimicrobiaceae bacterium]|jgi:hypothetical protein
MSVHSALVRLGELRVKSEADFEQVLGPPSAFRILFSGNRLVEWRSGRFDAQSIVVLFDASQQFLEVVAACNLRLPESVEPEGGTRPPARAEGRRHALDLFAGA